MYEKNLSILGLGGGGCRIIHRLAADCGDNSPAIISVDTDADSLASYRAAIKLQIGASHTNGLGAGGDVNLGRLAAESDLEMIQELFKDTKLMFLVVALGGGTGTGAASVVLNAARDVGAVTLCFATLPFEFEGRQQKESADQAVAELRAASDALITIPNDKLFELAGKTKVAEAFQTTDEVLSTGIGSIYKLITRPGFINIDLAHLKNAIQNSGGVCSFGYGEGIGGDGAKTAVASLCGSSLTEEGQVISRARSLLVSIIGGPDLAMQDVGVIMEFIKKKAPENCNISMGTVIDDGWSDRVTVAIIASDQRVSEPAPAVVPEFPLAVEEKTLPEQLAGGKKKKKSRELQAKLRLEPSGKGRFKNIEPTILDGEDMDIPAFVRRGIVIEK
ncbi:cell division protein FtsZ [Verrucomicrobiota bacterium]